MMDALTPQQRFDRFLALCSKGLCDKQVAHELGVSKTYIVSARKVLGIPCRWKGGEYKESLAIRNTAILEAIKANPTKPRKLIAKQFGVNVTTIYNLAFRNRVSRQRTHEVEVPFQ